MKKYSAQPSSDQKDKIKKSYERALAYTSRENVTLKAWNLVMPVDPTPPSLKWFRELTDQGVFSCSWLGQDFLDSLASEFPDVVDYYFRDGKERLSVAIAEFTAMSRIRTGIDKSVEPAEAIEHLRSAHSLINKLDPHFNYDFSVDSDIPTIDADQSGLAFASVIGTGDCYVTVRVIEKYTGSLDDRPINGQGALHTPDEESRKAVRDFFEFGAPLQLDSATLSVDLPGGLDGSERTGPISIYPRQSSEQDKVILRFRIETDTEELETVQVQVDPYTTGLDGRNWRTIATEWPAETFSVEQRFTEETRIMKLDFAIGELTGKNPDEVLPGLRFIRSLTPGRVIRAGRKFGPMTDIRYPVGTDLSHLVPGPLLDLIESISTIQSVTSEQLTVPDLDQLTTREAVDIDIAARLIRGEEVAVSTPEIKVESNGSPMSDGNFAVYFVNEHRVLVGRTEVSIGNVGFHADAVSATVDRTADGTPVRSILRPFGESEVIRGRLQRHTD
ncbi:hypothetical protein [Pseudonocardia phyllosphaerae]|uniref:hypothetical protein n=1 Tax=Pseudonocardia phyllosphaerae TaxID=3390502 RepID=UPI00397E58BF